MTESGPYLCGTCPGKDDVRVDFDVLGSCVRYTADSFKQARRYWLQDPAEYSNDLDELASNVAGGLIYYDEEEDDNYFKVGDFDAAFLGGLCAQRFLEGNCTKTRAQIETESDTD